MDNEKSTADLSSEIERLRREVEHHLGRAQNLYQQARWEREQLWQDHQNFMDSLRRFRQ